MRTYAPVPIEEDPAVKLAEFCANVKWEDLQPQDIERSKQAMLDELGVMLGGTGRNSSPAAADFAKRYQCENGDARVIGYGYKCPMTIAAFPNGTFGRALDMGDCHIIGGHLSEETVPVLLSAINYHPDKPLSGKDFIMGNIVGSEWGVRHHDVYNFHYHTLAMPAEMGWVQSCASLAKAVGLNKDQFINAMGLAFTANSMSTNQKNNESTEGARLYHGFVASDAIKACMMAEAGQSGPHSIYYGDAGVLSVIPWDDVDPDKLTADLGKRWMYNEGNQLTIKPYASCKFTHSIIYCMCRLRELHNIDYRKIAKIHATVSNNCEVTVLPERWNPTKMGDIMYGIPFTVAHAAITGDVQLDAMTFENMHDPDHLDLIKKVTFDRDPNMAIFDGYKLKVTMDDGTVYEYTDDGFPGSPANPMTWDQIEKKFRNLVKFSVNPLSDEKLDKIVYLCKNLEQVEDLNELMDCLVP